jgi:hypothetical protein
MATALAWGSARWVREAIARHVKRQIRELS